MHTILGATGHIGSALAKQLLARGESVQVVLHDAQHAAEWQARRALVSVLDVNDTAALRLALARGQRAFLLNPPAPPATDTDAHERASAHSLAAAVHGLGLEQVVVQSAYGAREGMRIGDLGSLYELERALADQGTPVRTIRAAYYLSNWDAALQSAREDGVVRSFYPLDFRLPMVAPQDIATVAAELLTTSAPASDLHYVEGPARYTPVDVAHAFGQALGKPVRAVETPHAEWPKALSAMGFSEVAAASFIGMTELVLHAEFPALSEVRRGSTTLEAYLAQLVERSAARAAE